MTGQSSERGKWCNADGVPDDNVPVTDWPVGCRPRRQPQAGLAQRRVVARGMTFGVFAAALPRGGDSMKPARRRG